MPTGPTLPPMISYAWNREDVVLRRLFPDAADGFYVDVGANDPVTGSVTKHFSDRGWRGINVEPIRRFAAALRAARPKDLTLELVLSDRPGVITFHEVRGPHGLSTVDPTQAAEYCAAGLIVDEYEVQVRTLTDVLDECIDGRTIDFLSIDVEGHEGAVLAGGQLGRWRPRVLLVESTLPWTSVSVHAAWEPGVLAAGYRFGLFDGVNRFYVRDEDAALLEHLTYGASVIDNAIPATQARLEEEVAPYRRMGRLARSVGAAVAGMERASYWVATRLLPQSVAHFARRAGL